MEYLLGAEWSISDRWLVSAGAQRTQTNLDENAYSDMNFSLPAWSFGVGFAFKINDAIRLNVGYMPTVYDSATSKGKASEIEFKDVFTRTSNAVGFGLDFKF
jgi:long-chain fatty acid transport protein